MGVHDGQPVPKEVRRCAPGIAAASARSLARDYARARGAWRHPLDTGLCHTFDLEDQAIIATALQTAFDTPQPLPALLTSLRVQLAEAVEQDAR
ncbi:hypothetical protein AB0F96_28780 [Streptomyces sp. NPDC023998]|uniref:hypothetical protein n=1 Tax=Streptomyces sp. NPDC023998 TaxID=3154597 RepID=UPI0033EF7AEA